MVVLQVSLQELKKWQVMTELDDAFVDRITLFFPFGFNGESALIVTEDDKVFGVGKNEMGQLGTGYRRDITTPIKIEQLCGKDIIEFSCGWNFCLGLTKEGEVFAWGNNSWGQLGQGDPTYGSPVPVLIPSLKHIKHIFSSNLTSWALDEDGGVYGWGDNMGRQCGITSTDLVTKPHQIDFPPNVIVSTMSSGYEFAVALSSNGKLYAWGLNNFGQLGGGKPLVNRHLPQLVLNQPEEGCVNVTCGVAHTLALGKDGHVYIWGYNKEGFLGTGSTELYILAPIKVDLGINKVLDILTVWKYYMTVVRTTDGVYMWGDYGDPTPNGGNNINPAKIIKHPTEVGCTKCLSVFYNKQTRYSMKLEKEQIARSNGGVSRTNSQDQEQENAPNINVNGT